MRHAFLGADDPNKGPDLAFGHTRRTQRARASEFFSVEHGADPADNAPVLQLLNAGQRFLFTDSAALADQTERLLFQWKFLLQKIKQFFINGVHTASSSPGRRELRGWKLSGERFRVPSFIAAVDTNTKAPPPDNHPSLHRPVPGSRRKL